MLLAPMAIDGAGADRLDGQRPLAGGALRPGAAAVLLLQAALRPGHQPADRPDPRGDRDEPRDEPRQRAQPVRRDARARPQAAARPADPAQPRARDAAPRRPRRLSAARTIDITWPVAEGPAGMAAAIERICRAGARGDRRAASTSSSSPTALLGPAARADPVAAGGRRGPPPPGAARARACAPGIIARVRRAARGAPLRDADRLRRERDQPLPDARDARRAGRSKGASCAPAPTARRVAIGAEEAAQNLVKAIGKGLLKTISKMGISTIQSYRGAQIFEAVGPRARADRPPLHRHRLAHRRRRPRGARARRRSSATRRAYPVAARRAAAGRRRLRVAARRRAPHVEPGDDRARPARRARRPTATSRAALQRRRARRTRAVRESAAFEKYREYARAVNEDAARRATLRGLLRDRRRPARGRADPARGGRAGERDRQALLHRRDEPRLDLARGARDARDRDEPPRRALEHGRGRRGPVALHARRQRRPAPLGDQAGRLRALRRDDPLPRQRRRAADQDGPGRQARRGRPAARPQGRRLHRLDPPHDARRRPDLAAAAPRHLLDRGPQAADLRPALRQPAGAGLGQARLRGRRRHGRGGRRPRRTPTAC